MDGRPDGTTTAANCGGWRTGSEGLVRGLPLPPRFLARNAQAAKWTRVNTPFTKWLEA